MDAMSTERKRSAMVRISVCESLRDKVAGFIEQRGLNWQLADAPPHDLRVAESGSGEPLECTGDTLYAGGWIKCSAAWALGVMHSIPLLALGALLNELDIKVKQCSLGCFE